MEYDLDDDDDAFIRALNATEARKKKKPLSEELFEAVIDFLEKESFFRVRRFISFVSTVLTSLKCRAFSAHSGWTR